MALADRGILGGPLQPVVVVNPTGIGSPTVAIDQSVPGVTNGVQVVAALPAGTNNIGDVDVLSLPAAVIAGMATLPAGVNNIGDVDVASIATGTNIIGRVGIDQATANANEVVVKSGTVTTVTTLTGITNALPAGTNLLGKVGIDQTTPGTTNKVTTDVVTATPTLYNVTCTVADTEYSQALPANTRSFEFQARTDVAVRYAFVTGKVAGSVAPFMTLKTGDYFYSPPINQGASPSTIYVASSIAGTVVEILVFV